jgi:ATP-binding cassette subfamily C (CFTR/MRP) protein 2
LQSYYFSTSRELTRVDALSKAPVIHHFSETIAGFVTIRCFQQQDRFTQINVNRVDSNLRVDFHNQAATEWVGLRMELIGIVILCASTLLLVALPEGYIKKGLPLLPPLLVSTGIEVAVYKPNR